MTKSKASSKKAPATPPAAAETEKAGPKGKLGALVALLLRPEGATLQAMQDATGWQPHSVRGAMAGSIKKKLGFEVTSEKTETGRLYRIAKGAGA